MRTLISAMIDVARGDNLQWLLDWSFFPFSLLPRYISASWRAYVSYLSALKRELKAQEAYLEYSCLDMNSNYVADKAHGANQVNIWQKQVV